MYDGLVCEIVDDVPEIGFMLLIVVPVNVEVYEKLYDGCEVVDEGMCLLFVVLYECVDSIEVDFHNIEFLVDL